MPITLDQPALERRLRRAANRVGYLLVKSRRRNPDHDEYGLYVLVADCRGNRLGRYGGQAAVSAFARGAGMTLADVEPTVAHAA